MSDELATAEEDVRLLRKENEQLRDALGMARTEYGGKPISELDEYDRLRLAANGFQAMDGVHRATINRLRADLAAARDRIAALEAECEQLEEPEDWTPESYSTPVMTTTGIRRFLRREVDSDA